MSPESLFDKRVSQIEFQDEKKEINKSRRRSRGERSVTGLSKNKPVLDSLKKSLASVPNFSEVNKQEVEELNKTSSSMPSKSSHKRLGTTKKSKSPTVFMPVLKRDPSPSSYSSISQKTSNPIKQLTSAISQLKSKQSTKSPGK